MSRWRVVGADVDDDAPGRLGGAALSPVISAKLARMSASSISAMGSAASAGRDASPLRADVRHPMEGIWRDRAGGGDVVDLAARHSNVRKLAVRQATQLGSQLPAFAPLLECIPTRFERTVDLPLCGCRSQLGGPLIVLIAVCPVWIFSQDKVAARCAGALNWWLTFSLPGAYSSCSGGLEVTPEGMATCAISSKITRLILKSVNCTAGRMRCQSHRRFLTCSIT